MGMPKKFPQVLREGSVSVRIYKTPVNGFDAFTVSYYEGGERKRIIRGKYEDAREKADEILRQLNRGILPGQQIKGEDRESYLAAKAKLKDTGVSLNEAIKDYTKALEQLDGRASLSEAVRFFVAHSPDRAKEKSVEEAYQLYLQRAEARTSKRNVETVKLHVGRFAEAFHCQLGDVSHEQIEAWMDRLNFSGRYFNNCRGALVSFFRWCRKNRFLPDLETEAEKVEKRPEVQQAVSIFSPDTMVKVLKEVRNDLVPYLVLSAFGGLRPSEARRLEWKDIDWKDGYIEIHATKARKTLRDRFVPLHGNLRDWLEPFRSEHGTVAKYKRPHEMLTAEMKGNLSFLESWPEDVLRHSYGSYRLAIIKSKQKLADEMGNSPEIIVQNYRRPVSKKVAKDWFAIQSASG